MKKTFQYFLFCILFIFFNVSPVYATENNNEENILSSPVEIIDGVIQRDEELSIEGFELPENINHNLNSINEETLYLLECLSLCGKTTDFYFFIENNADNTIPYEYINMLSNNYTPFNFYLMENGIPIATINTNGVTLDNGDFPIHVQTAYGTDFVQLSFNSDAVLHNSYILTLNCGGYKGYSYDIIENGNVTISGYVSETETITIDISSLNTKVIQFYKSSLPATEEYQSYLDGDTRTDIEQESSTKIWIVFMVLGIVAVTGVAIFTFLIKRNKPASKNTKKKDK